MKPVTQKLRSLGIVTIIYLDDLLILADSYKNAEENVKTALNLLRSLGNNIPSPRPLPWWLAGSQEGVRAEECSS
ncbi:unnamed protein product [Callosobruchus maculatus]|uniref:Reverse transcriptase domain-containing protein n=1 Tax=Callosobruchus maculatus TaxID=64391 RepID=A0A653C8D3_CALMS|nr:unnamed protein product [Callosobruchus maculatus]